MCREVCHEGNRAPGIRSWYGVESERKWWPEPRIRRLSDSAALDPSAPSEAGGAQCPETVRPWGGQIVPVGAWVASSPPARPLLLRSQCLWAAREAWLRSSLPALPETSAIAYRMCCWCRWCESLLLPPSSPAVPHSQPHARMWSKDSLPARRISTTHARLVRLDRPRLSTVLKRRRAAGFHRDVTC